MSSYSGARVRRVNWIRRPTVLHVYSPLHTDSWTARRVRSPKVLAQNRHASSLPRCLAGRPPGQGSDRAVQAATIEPVQGQRQNCKWRDPEQKGLDPCAVQNRKNHTMQPSTDHKRRTTRGCSIRLRTIRLRPAGRNQSGQRRNWPLSKLAEVEQMVFTMFLLFLFLFFLFVTLFLLLFSSFVSVFVPKNMNPEPRTLRWPPPLDNPPPDRPSTGQPSAGPPLHWTTRNFVFFPSPALIFVLFLCLGVFSWNFSGV